MYEWNRQLEIQFLKPCNVASFYFIVCPRVFFEKRIKNPRHRNERTNDRWKRNEREEKSFKTLNRFKFYLLFFFSVSSFLCTGATPVLKYFSLNLFCHSMVNFIFFFWNEFHWHFQNLFISFFFLIRVEWFHVPMYMHTLMACPNSNCNWFQLHKKKMKKKSLN